MNACSQLALRLGKAEFTRIIAFGSSNTERRLVGMHWLDCFELAVLHTYKRNFTCINSGIGGHTTRNLLQRFERDCLSYRPNIVFITIGGNDAKPEEGISVSKFTENLHMMIDTLRSIDCSTVLQTYYAMDMDQLSDDYTPRFIAMMDAVREVSAASGCLLIDHHARWERLRLREYDRYAAMMADPMHVNSVGNQVMGLDIARTFSLSLPDDIYFREARVAQTLLDRLQELEEGAACR